MSEKAVYNGAKVPARFVFEGEVVTLQPRQTSRISEAAVEALRSVQFYYGSLERPVPPGVVSLTLLGADEAPEQRLTDAQKQEILASGNPLPPDVSPPADPCGVWDRWEERFADLRLRVHDIVSADLL